MYIKTEIAVTDAQFAFARQLFQDYARFLGVDLEFQGFSEELQTLPTMYGPPTGAIILAKQEGAYVGVVGLRPFAPGIAEMKRMYVCESLQGAGIGRRLVQEFLNLARGLGYEKVWLDTIPELSAAVGLYRSMGFADMPAYRFNPHPEAIFLEYNLG